MIAKDQTVLRYWASRANLFNDYYTDPSWFDRVFRKAIFLRAMVAIDVCRKLPEPTVLDVGSGPGINSVALIQEGHARAVTGIDFAESMNELAREQARSRGVDDRCHFIQGDFMGHSFDAKSFDLVVALGVFDYVDEPRQFLTRIAEYARAKYPGETIYANYPWNPYVLDYYGLHAKSFDRANPPSDGVIFLTASQMSDPTNKAVLKEFRLDSSYQKSSFFFK